MAQQFTRHIFLALALRNSHSSAPTRFSPTICRERPGPATMRSRFKSLIFPTDLRDFRTRAGCTPTAAFTPDIAFSIQVRARKCKSPYVFGVFPRLTRAPYDSLGAVHRSIEESLRASPRPGRCIPRALKKWSRARARIAVSRSAMHIRTPCTSATCCSKPAMICTSGLFSRQRQTRQACLLALARAIKPPRLRDASRPKSEGSFMKAFGCHFSVRAVWNEIFRRTLGRRQSVITKTRRRGMWLIFRPSKSGRRRVQRIYLRNNWRPTRKRACSRASNRCSNLRANRPTTAPTFNGLRISRKNSDQHRGMFRWNFFAG